MGMTNQFRDYLAQCAVGESVTPFNAANAHIGVGDSTVAFAATQTALQAATNRTRRPMEATYPQRAANLITLRALFGTGDANYEWNEWGIFNAATGGVMMARKVEPLGAKTAAMSRQITVTASIDLVP